ncbi:MAG: fimbrillin family protein [Bacteroides sp.]|nr:fimbrillin family protein [Bacteroides sp.]
MRKNIQTAFTGILSTALPTLAAALLTLGACDLKDADCYSTYTEPEPVALQIAGAVITAPNADGDADISTLPTRAGISNRTSITTRATDNAWQAGDAVGIVLLNPDTATPLSGKTVYKYTTATADPHFLPADETNTVYFPADGKSAEVLAFCPYREIGDGLVIPVSTADQRELSQIDLLVAEKSTHDADDPSVSLAFSHRLAKLTITVDREATAAGIELKDATLTLTGTATTANWSLTKAALTDIGTVADIALPTVYDAAATSTLPGIEPGRLTATAIVLPTAAGAGVKLVLITAAGKRFEAALPADIALAAGTVGTLGMHLQREEAVIGDITIAPWGNTREVESSSSTKRLLSVYKR